MARLSLNFLAVHLLFSTDAMIGEEPVPAHSSPQHAAGKGASQLTHWTVHVPSHDYSSLRSIASEPDFIWLEACKILLRPPLARLIQNGFTGEAKAGEARKTGFSRLLVHFNPGLQNGFTYEAKAGEARKTGFSRLLVHFNPDLQKQLHATVPRFAQNR